MSKFNNVPMWFCDLGFYGLDKVMLCIYSWKVIFMALGLGIVSDDQEPKVVM
jgi:hypothetical protein